MASLEEKVDSLLVWAEEQKQWNQKTTQRLDKAFQWMEKMSELVLSLKEDLKEFKLYQFQKNDELFEIVTEMRDDLKILKIAVGSHEDAVKEFKKHTQDNSRHLTPSS